MTDRSDPLPLDDRDALSRLAAGTTYAPARSRRLGRLAASLPSTTTSAATLGPTLSHASAEADAEALPRVEDLSGFATELFHAPPSPAATLPPECDTLAFHGLLAEGGFGEVWTATQQDLGRPVAVKRLKPSLLASLSEADRKELVEMFQLEAQVTAHLEHPNILPIYRLDEAISGEALLVMRRVGGRPWSEQIQADQDLPVDELLARHIPILIDVAQAVAYAHSRGVLHRDLKPQQVMVGAFGEVLLLDWGLAMPLRSGVDGLDTVAESAPSDGAAGGSAGGSTGGGDPTGANPLALPLPNDGASNESRITGGPAGTPAFMAPEQAEAGIDQIVPATDVYLLGGCLYQLLTLRAPRPGRSGLESMARIDQPIARASEAAPHRKVPPELDELAASVLRLQPEDREPRSAAAFAERLQAYLTGSTRRRKARQLLEQVAAAPPSTDYDELSRRQGSVREAERLWPEHPDLATVRARIGIESAETALSRGDLELARAQTRQLPAGEERDRLDTAIEQGLNTRRRQARQRRLALATSAILVALLALGGLRWAHDLRSVNAELSRQRDAAQDARNDAEGLVTFLIDDLNDRLMSIDQIDLLGPVARQAADYYADADPGTLDAADQLRHAIALTDLASVFQAQADDAAALASLTDAMTSLQAAIRDRDASPAIRREALSLSVEAAAAAAIHASDLGERHRSLEILDTAERRLDEAERETAPGPVDEVSLSESLAWRARLEASRGLFHYDAGSFEAAERSFRSALDRLDARPVAPSGWDETLWNVQTYLAATLNDLERFDDALDQLGRMRASASFTESTTFDRAFFSSMRATTLLELGRIGEATAEIEVPLEETLRRVAAGPELAQERLLAAQLLDLRARSLEARGAADAAATERREALELLAGFDSRLIRDQRVRLLLGLGEIEAARPLARELVDAGWRYNRFATVLRRGGLGELLPADEPSG